MDFSAVNWLAVIVAAVVAWLFGACLVHGPEQAVAKGHQA